MGCRLISSLRAVSSFQRFLAPVAVLLLVSIPAANADVKDTVAVTLQFATNRHHTYAFRHGHQVNEKCVLPPGVSADRALVFETITTNSLAPVADKYKGITYSRLWIDMDGNGMYGNEEFLQLDLKRHKAPTIPPFLYLVNDGEHKHRVPFHGYLNLLNPTPMLVLQSGTSFEGAANIGGHDLFVSVRDDNGDGRVVEFPEDESKSETLFCIALATDTNDLISLPLARTMMIFSQPYAVDLSMGGTENKPRLELKMTPTNLPLGDLEIDGQNVKWLSMTQPGITLVAMPDEHNRCRIPAGKSEFYEIVVTEKNHDYRAHQNWFGSTSDIEVEEGKTVSRKIGGPLKHELEVKGTLMSGRVTIKVGHSKGIEGLAYEPITCGFSGLGWFVRSSNGKVVATGKFNPG